MSSSCFKYYKYLLPVCLVFLLSDILILTKSSLSMFSCLVYTYYLLSPFLFQVLDILWFYIFASIFKSFIHVKLISVYTAINIYGNHIYLSTMCFHIEAYMRDIADTTAIKLISQ